MKYFREYFVCLYIAIKIKRNCLPFYDIYYHFNYVYLLFLCETNKIDSHGNAVSQSIDIMEEYM